MRSPAAFLSRQGGGLLRYPRLWTELLRLSWRVHPWLSTATLGFRILSVFTFAAVGLALREAIDAGQQRLPEAALLGAVGAAVAYAVNHVVNTVGLSLRLNVLEQVGLTELDTKIVSDITSIETLDHLEENEFLDRVTVLRDAAWGLMDSAWAAVESIVNVARLAVSLLLLSSINPYLFILLAFAAVPLWFDARSNRSIVRAEIDTAESIRVQRHLYDLATSVDAGKEIRVTGAGPALVAGQKHHWSAAHRLRFQAQLIAAVWQSAGWIIFTLGFASGLALVIWQVARGQGSSGDVVLGITVATSLRGALKDAVSRSAETVGYRRLLDPYLWLREYAEHARRARASARQSAPDSLHHGIDLVDLSYTYPGTARPAVAGVSVHIPAGSVVAVVGEYGSGKTTLVKLLCKFHEPSTGKVTVDGTPLTDMDTAHWRTRISTAFQDFGRYHTAFREAVGLGEPLMIENRARIEESIAAADATSIVERLPDGLETTIGREFGGLELSEGQWQKVALARACMREQPLLFILDEPTASLDAPSEHAVYEHHMLRARNLAARIGAITVIVSHRFSTVAGADLILVMQQGQLIEAGTHGELFALGGTYTELIDITRSSYLSKDFNG